VIIIHNVNCYHTAAMSARFAVRDYAAASYVVFLAAVVYAVGFVGDSSVPRSVSHGIAAAPGQAVAVNVALLGCSPSNTAFWRGRRSNDGGLADEVHRSAFAV
jgi:hypothetical protein